MLWFCADRWRLSHICCDCWVVCVFHGCVFVLVVVCSFQLVLNIIDFVSLVFVGFVMLCIWLVIFVLLAAFFVFRIGWFVSAVILYTFDQVMGSVRDLAVKLASAQAISFCSLLGFTFGLLINSIKPRLTS